MTRDVEEFGGLTTTVRGLSAAFISPPLQEFYGFDAGTMTGYQLKDGKCTVQEGRHIHFAAAQNDEVAREVTPPGGDTHGAFTYAMLSLLDDELGLLSYGQLAGGIKGKIQNYFFNGSARFKHRRSHRRSTCRHYLVKDNIFLSNKSALGRSAPTSFNTINNMAGASRRGCCKIYLLVMRCWLIPTTMNPPRLK